jgi:hypothetical protein
VLEDQLLAEFAESLRGQAADALGEEEQELPLAPHAALAKVMLGYLEEAGAISDEFELAPHEDAGMKRPCRCIGLALGEDSTRLELFTAHALGEGEGSVLPGREVARLSGWAARFFEYAAKGDHARFAGNPAAAEAARLIQDALPRIEDVRIHVLTDAMVRDRSVADITVVGREVQTEVWDVERLYRASGEEVTRERIEIDFAALMGRPIACLEMKPRPAEYETYMVILPGDLVYQLYERYGALLFEFNVRSFLQAKGGVNKGIRKTIEEEPGRFLAYNNGLTATADEIEVGMWSGETVIKRIRGLQIVNGAQTTASIHRAKKVDKLPVDKVAVAMKLTLVPADKLKEFVPLIAQYANTQNPIQIADLAASEEFHQDFEDLSESTWCPGEETRWFYERARGSYQVARIRYGSTPAKRREFDRVHPKSKHFGKADIAKYLMTWWGDPATVSRGAQKNHKAFMTSLKVRMGEGWRPDRTFFEHTIAKAIVFKTAQAVVKKAKLQSYGANVVTYMVAKLAADWGTRIDLDAIWDEQDVSGELKAMFADWAPRIHAAIVETAGKRNVTEWCKKDACWEAIRALDLPTPDLLPPELGDDAGPDSPADEASTHKQQDPVIACMALDGAAWAKVMAWVAANPGIEEFDRKVAHTVAGYAIDGWHKEPSLKQAVRGVRVIEAARKAGVLDAEAA